jgi:hypothetical protein
MKSSTLMIMFIILAVGLITLVMLQKEEPIPTGNLINRVADNDNDDNAEKNNNNIDNPISNTEKFTEGMEGMDGGVGGEGGVPAENPSEKNENMAEYPKGNDCMIIRPGNLPGIECEVNYITKNSTSLKMKNGFGEDISIIASLSGCNPIIFEKISNNRDKDFIFSCKNEGYFNKEISLTYVIGDETEISIGGFVSGPVLD